MVMVGAWEAIIMFVAWMQGFPLSTVAGLCTRPGRTLYCFRMQSRWRYKGSAWLPNKPDTVAVGIVIDHAWIDERMHFVSANVENLQTGASLFLT